jgi:hypothetical protein
MGKRNRNRRRHLALVNEGKIPLTREDVFPSGNPDCNACHGTGLVRDQHGIDCICLPCYREKNERNRP